ncbi:MAG TPA: DUF2807 domain-containing protein [Chthoniobacterales bacterium]|nr:DUF2807 domain-containing protein [Chthoniobacterales bacterium]
MKTIPVRPLLTLKLATLAAAAFAMLVLSGCEFVGEKGNGNVITDTRPVTDFTRLEADGAFNINWSPGPAALKITTDSNLLEFIRTSVSDGRFYIEWVKPLKGTRGIKVDISSPSLTHATLNGAVKLNAASLSGTEFYLEANGASRITLQGNVNALSGEMNGASKLEAEHLETRAMELEINGAGRADVNASDALKVAISGAGKVTYAGDPQVSREISGAGSVRKRNAD